jgi:cytoskeletal protein CcmA (bactofilin family)
MKDAQAMSKSPFSAVNPVPPPPSTPARPLGGTPGINPARPPVKDPAERRTLVVGRGISVQGTVQDAERLVVEGTVEASMIRATELSIAPGGVFKGEVEVDEAEIAGTIDGTLVAKAALVVRASGRVLGTARCRRLQVEDGGQITGRIEMITEPASAAPAPSESPAKPSSEPAL